jgi:hypothetical protein
MSRSPSPSAHLLRMALLFAAGLVVFLAVRALLVPQDFGRYGHYRPGAAEENRGRPLFHAGEGACADCHEDVAEAKAPGPHAGVRCEACHGPLKSHADDPEAVKPARPAVPALCLRCHREDGARPSGFPAVDGSHGGGEPCLGCHKPHDPRIS